MPHCRSSIVRVFPILALISGLVAGSGIAPPAPMRAQADTNTVSPWQVVPSPDLGAGDAILYAVAASSAKDAWAVGYSHPPKAGRRTLIEHWDGKTWSIANGADLHIGQYDSVELDGVTAISAKDAWAVGSRDFGSGAPIIEHWNGQSWSAVSSGYNGNAFLYAVAATSSKDVWAVGRAAPKAGSFRSIVLHYDGRGWAEVPVPHFGTAGDSLEAVSADAPNDVWAVGQWVDTAPPGAHVNVIGRNLTLHWDGKTWTALQGPNPSYIDSLQGVAASSAKDVWAAGWTMSQPGPGQTFPGQILHFAGGPATQSLFAGVQFSGAAASSPKNAWIVGAGSGANGNDVTAIYHWDGKTLKPAEQPAFGDLNGVTVVPGGGAWAVGNDSCATLCHTLIMQPASLPVKGFDISYSGWESAHSTLDTQIATARDDVTRLTNQRADAQAKLAGTQTTLDSLNAQVDSLAQQKRDAEKNLRTLLAKEPTLAKRYRSYLDTLNYVRKNIVQLEAQINADPPPPNLTKLLDDRDQEEQEALKLEQIIEAHLDPPDRSNEASLRAKVASLDNQYWDAVKQQAHVQSDVDVQNEVLAKMQDDIDQRQNRLDQLLLQKGLLDRQDTPLVREITIHQGSATGPVVYDATKWAPDSGIASLDELSAADRAELQQLDAERQQARQLFESAEQEAIARNDDVYRAIWKSAIAQAGIETAYYIYDVANGWKEGGPVGALFEAGKKLADAWVFSGGVVFENFNESDLAKQFDQEYNGTLKTEFNDGTTAMVGKTAAKTVGKAILKDATTKPIKGYFANKAGGLMADYFSSHSAPKLEKAIDEAVFRSQRKQIVEAARTQVGRINKLLDPTKFSWKKTLTQTLVKDLTKQFAKAAVQKYEEAAWVEFFAADLVARVRARAFLDVSGAYWEQYDLVQAEEALKEQIPPNWDPKTGWETTVSQPLDPNQTYYVVLQLAQPQGHEAKITVLGQGATPVTATTVGKTEDYTFSFSPGDLSPLPKDGLSLHIDLLN